MTQIAITILTNKRWTTRSAHQIISSRKETGFSQLQSLLLITYADGFASQATFSRLLDKCFLYRKMVQLGLILPRDTTITAQNTTWVGPGFTSALVSGPWPTCYLVNIYRPLAAIAPCTTYVRGSMDSVGFVRMRAREALPSILDTKDLKAATEGCQGAFNERPPAILVGAVQKWVQTLHRGNCSIRGIFETAQMLRAVAVFLFWE